MKRRLFLTLTLAGWLFVGPGCVTTHQSSCGPVTCFPRYTGATPGIAPCDRCPQPACAPAPVAPAPIPVAPPAAAAFPATAPLSSIASLPAPPGSYSSAMIEPAGAASLDPGVRLFAPLPDGPGSPENTKRLYGDPLPQEPPPAPMPSFPGDKEAAPPLPVDVPNFVVAKDRVATGLQPFPDGIAWLQAHHYRTVLHVRAPGEDDSAARRLFERHELRYLSLETSPTTLNRSVVEQFNRMVREEGDLPMFVYDRDGALVGGLWYLYFRTAEGMSDERARAEAARLGFRPDGDGEQRTMWVAVQRYLSSPN